MAGPVNYSGLFSDTESDDEPFEGFDIRETRRYSQVARKAELFTSTPIQKRKRSICNSSSSNSSSSDNKYDAPNVSGIDVLSQTQSRKVTDSSSSSVEGEIAEDHYSSLLSFHTFSHSSNPECIAEDDSNSSVEGEVAESFFESIPGTPGNAKIDKLTEDTSLERENQTLTGNTRKIGKKRSTIFLPESLVREKCCVEKQCLQEVLSVEQMRKAREGFCQEYSTYKLQRQYILNWFDQNQPIAGEFTYSISGLSVCSNAWTKVLGITRRRFFLLKKEYLLGRRSSQHGASLIYRDQQKTESAKNFLEKYFTENCDFMPNSSVWHLTSTSRKTEVYQEFQETMRSTRESPCSESLFRSIWNTCFSHVKIPKENRFSKCDTCCNLKDELRETTNPIKKAVIEERRKQHVNWVREERKSYLSRASQAHYEPQKYFSVAIDGMDTTKTELPFSRSRHGTSQKAWHLRVHVVGVLIHGRHPICFLDYHQFPHDSNLLINILLQTLWLHKEFLAPSLFIQLDNTAKENKNQYVFCFLAYLVETEVFERVEISFLPVGHTHIDVDQLFSRISVATEKLGCLTPQDLLRIIRNCYKQNQGETTEAGAQPQYAITPHLYAVREWLLPHMKQIHGLNSFHSFVITRNDDRKAVLHFKAWCTTKWESVEQYDPIVLLNDVPQGVPELLKPNYSVVDLSKLRTMVDKCYTNGVFRQEEKTEWLSFIEKEEKVADGYENVDEIVYKTGDEGAKYHKKDLTYMSCSDQKWLVDELRTRKRPAEESNIQLSEVLRRSEAFERGDGLLPVYTGSYRRPGQVQRQVLRNESRDSVAAGMLVAVTLETYAERPLIGRVETVTGDTLQLTWMHGHWTTRWSVCKRREGNRHVEWTEEIPKSSVILFDFQLTPTGKLRAATVNELKRVYGLEENDDDD